MRYIYLSNVDIFHFIISKKSHLFMSSSILSERSKYWETVRLMVVEEKLFHIPIFAWKLVFHHCQTWCQLFSFILQTHFVYFWENACQCTCFNNRICRSFTSDGALRTHWIIYLVIQTTAPMFFLSIIITLWSVREVICMYITYIVIQNKIYLESTA